MFVPAKVRFESVYTAKRRQDDLTHYCKIPSIVILIFLKCQDIKFTFRLVDAVNQ